MIRSIIYVGLIIVVLLIGTYFGLLNNQEVSVNFYFFSLTVTMSILVAVIFSVGLILGALGIYFLIALPLQAKLFLLQRKLQKDTVLTTVNTLK